MINKPDIIDAFKVRLPNANEAVLDRLAEETIYDATMIIQSIIRQKSRQEQETTDK